MSLCEHMSRHNPSFLSFPTLSTRVYHIMTDSQQSTMTRKDEDDSLDTERATSATSTTADIDEASTTTSALDDGLAHWRAVLGKPNMASGNLPMVRKSVDDNQEAAESLIAIDFALL
jgi:hypothetical protein